MAAETPGRTAQLVQCEGNTWVDRDPCSGDFVLSHKISQERHIYTGFHDIFLEFVDDDAVLLCRRTNSQADDDGNVVFKYLDQELAMQVYDKGEGDDRFLILVAQGERPQSLEDLKRQHRVLHVSFRCGAQGMQSGMEAAEFQHGSFGGSRVRWNLHELFDRLRLRCHRGERWMWVVKNWGVWFSMSREMYPMFDDNAFAKGMWSSMSDGTSGKCAVALL